MLFCTIPETSLSDTYVKLRDGTKWQTFPERFEGMLTSVN